MGMDCFIIAAKNKQDVINGDWGDNYFWNELKNNPNFWDEDLEIIKYPNKPIEMWYARKPQFLMNGVPYLKESYQKPYVIRLTKENIKDMIECHAFHPDHFNSFNSLPQLCEIYQEYDNLQAQSIFLYFCNSY